MAYQLTDHLEPQLGHEYIISNEDEIIQEMVNEMQDQMKRMYAEKLMPRQIHTKMHGCVKGRFVIQPNLPEELKVGIFSQERNYHCYIRFSNSQTVPKPDKKKDIRGIAIKLLGVKGEKVLNNKRDADVQDFLLMSSETFFSKNIGEFRQTLKSSTAKNKAHLLLYFLNPKHWKLFGRLMKSMVKCENPLDMSYWSTQPYRFGNGYRAVKYFLKPSPENNIVNENLKEDNYLQINLSQTLHNNSAKFDFFVQFQTDAEKMPIEDPTVPWDSEYIKVATLEIPAQEFESEDDFRYGQNLSFNSWHALTEHRPLGSFNRARKRVYEAMSEFRHKWNRHENKEPEDRPDFLDGTSWPKNNVITHAIPKKKVICVSTQTMVNCGRKEAFEFIISNEELPNWLKAVGMFHSALNAEVKIGTYNHVGAKRKVNFDGGDSVLEELVSYNPYANYSYKVSEFTNSLRHLSSYAYGQLWFDRFGEQTRITWVYTIKPKNLVYQLILHLILPKKLKAYMQQSLINAKHYIENGD